MRAEPGARPHAPFEVIVPGHESSVVGLLERFLAVMAARNEPDQLLEEIGELPASLLYLVKTQMQT